MTPTVNKARLVDFIFAMYEDAELRDIEGLRGEAAGMREVLHALAATFGISKPVMYLARQGAREYAEMCSEHDE